MDDPRVRTKIPGTPGPGPVYYWMQAAVRTDDNPALQAAWNLAREAGRPLVVFFTLIKDYPEANRRSFTFLVQGLEDVASRLSARGIAFWILDGRATDLLSLLDQDSQAPYALVFDRGYLPYQKGLRSQAASRVSCPVWEVDTEAAVPVDLVSPKAEWSAATLRRKILPLLPFYADPREAPVPGTVPGENLPRGWEKSVLSLGAVKTWIQGPQGPAGPAEVTLQGGETAALDQLEAFLSRGLEGYAHRRNDPNLFGTSGLSPWLHYGHLSPRRIRQKVLEAQPGGEDGEAFLEELIVRRELSFNYTWYQPLAGSYAGLPSWAQKTLAAHSLDRREVIYGLEPWERAQTHDRGWNAAQNQLVRTGQMAGYMRMYWGKKILEWSATPEQAFKTALHLNNKYALDGRDPNSIAGVAWCFGLHDRPWSERKVFGMIRYMNENGLKRKFDLGAYVSRWEG